MISICRYDIVGAENLPKWQSLTDGLRRFLAKIAVYFFIKIGLLFGAEKVFEPSNFILISVVVLMLTIFADIEPTCK